MMVKKLCCFLIAINSVYSIFGQSWVFIQKQDVYQKITAGDIGALGKLYIGTERGNVYSFQMDGTPDAQFSSAVFLPVTDLDASNSLRVFVFYKDAGRFEYLDRFTAQPRTYYLEDFGIERASHAALDDDGSIWLLDDNNLRHINLFNNSLLSSEVLPRTFEFDSITDIAFNQALLFLDKEQGIVSWDGKSFSMETQPVRGVLSFDVFDNELVALSEQGILVDNYEKGTKSFMKPPIGGYSRVFKTGEIFHFVRGSEIFSYRFEK